MFLPHHHGYDVRAERLAITEITADSGIEPGTWQMRGAVLVVHCANCVSRALYQLTTDPDRFQRRTDGWPLCPSCGEDELWSPFLPLRQEDKTLENYLAHELRCYRCPSVLIPAGAALPPGGPR